LKKFSKTVLSVFPLFLVMFLANLANLAKASNLLFAEE
jgi:hypothetical protein